MTLWVFSGLSACPNHIPTSGQTFIKGTVKTVDQVILPRDPQTYETIRQRFNQLELSYAYLKQLQDIDVSTIFAISGDFYFRTIFKAQKKRHLSQTNVPTNFQPVSMSPRVYTVEMYLHDVRHLFEILVSEGQHLQAGDLVAKLSSDNEATLALEEAKLKLKIQQLKAQAGDTSSLFVTAARLRLTEIKRQRDKYNIYSPVNAQILLIRVVAVHNNSLTIAIKLLVNAPQSLTWLAWYLRSRHLCANRNLHCKGQS